LELGSHVVGVNVDILQAEKCEVIIAARCHAKRKFLAPVRACSASYNCDEAPETCGASSGNGVVAQDSEVGERGDVDEISGLEEGKSQRSKREKAHHRRKKISAILEWEVELQQHDHQCRWTDIDEWRQIRRLCDIGMVRFLSVADAETRTNATLDRLTEQSQCDGDAQ
jgi:hypothetical protein